VNSVAGIWKTLTALPRLLLHCALVAVIYVLLALVFLLCVSLGGLCGLDEWATTSPDRKGRKP